MLLCRDGRQGDRVLDRQRVAGGVVAGIGVVGAVGYGRRNRRFSRPDDRHRAGTLAALHDRGHGGVRRTVGRRAVADDGQRILEGLYVIVRIAPRQRIVRVCRASRNPFECLVDIVYPVGGQGGGASEADGGACSQPDDGPVEFRAAGEGGHEPGHHGIALLDGGHRTGTQVGGRLGVVVVRPYIDAHVRTFRRAVSKRHGEVDEARVLRQLESSFTIGALRRHVAVPLNGLRQGRCDGIGLRISHRDDLLLILALAEGVELVGRAHQHGLQRHVAGRLEAVGHMQITLEDDSCRLPEIAGGERQSPEDPVRVLAGAPHIEHVACGVCIVLICRQRGACASAVTVNHRRTEMDCVCRYLFYCAGHGRGLLLGHHV